MDYRKKIEKNTVCAEIEDVEKGTEFLDVDTMTDIIGEIEIEVNTIMEMLNRIEGLTEINEIKDKIYELSNDLY